MSNKYTPLSERTSSYEPTKGPWGRPSDLVHYARKKGWLDELGVNFLDKELIVQASDTHSKSIEEWEQSGEWTDDDTQRNVLDMLKPFGDIDNEVNEVKEAGRKMHDTKEKKDKETPQTIKHEDLMTNKRMPADIRDDLSKSKAKVEPTSKEKQENRKGKYQQKQKQDLKDYTKR